MTAHDPFELEVRDAFRRHAAGLDPLVPMPAIRADTSFGVLRRPVRLTRASRPLPGLAFALLVLLVAAAAILGPSVFRRQVSATPSPSPSPLPAKWTALDWSRARTDGASVEQGAPNAAWHDGWALANAGSVSVSKDGASWSKTLEFPSTSVLGLVAPAPRGFVALDTYLEPSDGKPVQAAVWQSDDGRSWREASTAAAFNGQNQIWDAAAGPRGIVAIGLSAPAGTPTAATTQFAFGAWFSPDGLIWQRISDAATFGSDPAFAIAATRDGFLMGGSFNGAAAIWRSSDGVHWERIELASEAGRRVRKIAAGAAGMIAIDGLTDARDGYASRAWISRDGSHWTRFDSPEAPEWVTGDGVRISGWWDEAATAPVPSLNSSTTSTYRHATSFDGITWSAVADARRTWWLAYSDDSVLAVDGETFYVVPAIQTPAAAPSPSSAAPSPSSAAPSPSSAAPSRTSTPSSTPVSPPAAAWQSLAFASEAAGGELPWAFSWPGGMVAGDMNLARAAVSGDGASWESVTLPTRAPVLVWTGSRLLAIASEGDGRQRAVWASRDGRSWSRTDDGSFAPGGPPIAFASGPAGTIAVTAAGELWRSDDGRSWTKATLDGMAGKTATGIAATERGFVIVVRNGSRGSSVPNAGVTLLTSADAVTWSPTTITGEPWTWVHVYPLGDGFVAYGGRYDSPDGPPSDAVADRAWRSADGWTWQAMSIASNLVVDGSTGSLIIAHEHQVSGNDGSANPLVLYESENGEAWQPLPVDGDAKAIHAPLIVAGRGVFFRPGFSLAPLLYYEGGWR